MDDVDGLVNEPRGQGSSKRPGLPVDPHRVRRALWSGKRWLIVATVVGATVGVFWAKVMMGNTFKTTAVLRYEGAPQIAGLDSSAGYPLGPAADALMSESLLGKLAEEVDHRGSLIALANAIDYEPDGRAGTLSVTVFSHSSQGAAEFARQTTDVFLAYHRERLTRRIEQELTLIEKRIDGAEGETAEARQRYNEFRDKHGIADLSSEQESIVDSAAKLRAESELASAEIRALKAQVANLQEQLANTPKTAVVGGGASPEREAYNQLRRELAAARASLSPEHPRVQSLRLQVEQMAAQARTSGSGLVGANTMYQSVSDELRQAKANLTVLTERQKGLAQLADQAQRRVESFSGIEGEASALRAEVEVNEALLGRLRTTEAALEDALEHTPSGFSVLDPGGAPEYPVASTSKRIAFLSISSMSALVALLFVLGREFRGLRVQTPSEVAFWGHGPVLAATPWPADPMGLEELIAGLDDLAPDAQGTLLVLGCAQDDAPLAQELARRMNHDWFVDGPIAVAPTPAASAPQGPIHVTPSPTSGPYPIGGNQRQPAALAQPSTALARRPVQLVRREQGARLEAWNGPSEGQALRRAARLADRVIVLVRSNGTTALALNGVRRRIGRENGVGYIVLGLSEELATLPDRIGDVAHFWTA